jgi:hypothetical protein
MKVVMALTKSILLPEVVNDSMARDLEPRDILSGRNNTRPGRIFFPERRQSLGKGSILQDHILLEVNPDLRIISSISCLQQVYSDSIAITERENRKISFGKQRQNATVDSYRSRGTHLNQNYLAITCGCLEVHDVSESGAMRIQTSRSILTKFVHVRRYPEVK